VTIRNYSKDFMKAKRKMAKIGHLGMFKKLLDLLRQITLIPLEDEHIIPSLLDNRRRDLLLLTHGLNGHNTPSQGQYLEQFRDRRDFR
jgi:hypothetical protein